MPHVVTSRCIGNRYTDCAAVCPVDCFYEVQEPNMLVIDPDTCIDCELCQEACPVNAIWPEDELPEVYAEWADKNRELYESGESITQQKGPLDGAKDLAEIQAEEAKQGLDITEPSGA
ncbi:MAG: ferredoxin family protein [Planctomycetota bacterium]